MKHRSTWIRWQGIVAIAAIAAAGCSVGGPQGTPVAASGIMTRGSVILGGVHYDDGAASVSADDGAATAADLASGMRVRLRGRVNDDGVTGTAEEVEIENEVRGAIATVGTGTFTVLGQTVYVDALTVFANGTWPADFGVTVVVEVHGQRTAAGDILASRVEKLGGTVQDEVRGTVTAKTGTDFGLVGGSLVFAWDGTTVIVGGTTFVDGDLVEVHLSGLHADRIELEDVEDGDFSAVGSQEVQGFVAGFTSHPGTFTVDGAEVMTTVDTRFDAGSAADLANDAVVEAEGTVSGGVLVVDRIAFKDTVRLEANATADDSANLFGITVVVTGLTEYDGIVGLGDIATGDGLRVRGYRNTDGSVTATRVKQLSNPVDADKHELQGVVSSFVAGSSLVIAGITVNVPVGVTVGGDDPPADRTAFFVALVAGRTVVKAKGTWATGQVTADEVSIE